MSDHDVPPSDLGVVGDPVGSVGALAEPSRRALYDYVVAARDWVSREQAASALGLRKGIAAHHLDRLADDGLLTVEYRRLTGRTGPGAGRPAKLYRRSATEVAVSLPPRHYDLVGEVLADAVDRSMTEGTDLANAIEVAARGAGRKAARAGDPGTGDARAALLNDLRVAGFEPEVQDDGSTVLHNCPFHQLAQRHTELICGANLSYMHGLLDEHPDADLEPVLAPADGYCCVRFRPSTGTGS